MADATCTLPVFFTTKTPYPLPAQKFMIPSGWKRYQLSQLVNKALALAQPIPFDFILRKTGELLRSSLEEWCQASGTGMEETLEIEYVESLLPPTHVAEIPHDDWVSDVSCSLQNYFITASYDGLLRVFDSSRALVHSIAGHTAPITSLCILPSFRSGETIFASSSQDMTARLSTYNPEAHTSTALASLHLHTAPLSSIAASPSHTHLITAGWDALLGIWDTTIPEADEVDAPDATEIKTRKRRRVATEDNVRRKAPLAVLKSHTTRVSTALFAPDDIHRAYSAGLDSTVRSWDTEAGVCVHTHTVPEAPIIALTHLTAPHLLVAASTDRSVRIFDTRSFSSDGVAEAAPVALQHASTPSALAPSPRNAHHFASGAYDGVVRVWDVRSTKGAVVSFRAGEGADAATRGDGKVLGLDWAGGVLAIGGEAGLDLWRVPEAEEAQ